MFFITAYLVSIEEEHIHTDSKNVSVKKKKKTQFYNISFSIVMVCNGILSFRSFRDLRDLGLYKPRHFLRFLF